MIITSLRLVTPRSTLRCSPVCSRLMLRSYTTPANLQRTPLYDLHLKNSAKMVPFAGWEMPLQYGKVGQVAAHNHVRNAVGLFDVSHMVQTKFTGPGATHFLEWLSPSSLASLPVTSAADNTTLFSSTLSVLLNENGGIIDDTIITKQADDIFYVVTNAGRAAEDMQWFKERLEQWKGGVVSMEVLKNWGLVALQGPLSQEALQPLCASFDLKQLTFGHSAFVPFTINGETTKLHVARGGYTGEDGFEISIPPSLSTEFTEALISDSNVQLTGLGARDSLRLEAGMCLYGNDLDETTSPVEAGLSWVIGKERKTSGGFIGAATVQDQLKNGPPRRRVGIIIESGAPGRHGSNIFAPGSDELIGVVTSGIPSPTLNNANIAMGYVKNGMHKKKTVVEVEVRGKRRKGEVVGMPFVPSKYYRG